MKSFPLPVLFLLSCLAFGQAPPAPYRLSAQIEADRSRDTTGMKDWFAMWGYSYIGEYQKALQLFDAVNPPEPNEPMKREDSLHLGRYKATNAVSYIVGKAKDAQIVVINEAHHVPQHRTFTTSLLEGLYRQGFRYLGVEGVSQEEKNLNQRKYPVSETGFYTQEPQFGELLRVALATGFEVFAYETTRGTNGKEREIDQARNIQQVLQRNPAARMLIYCGHSHVQEGSLATSWEKAMAGRLKEFTGIDPLTINQEPMTERGSPDRDDPLYRRVPVTEPTVLVDAAGKAFNGFKDPKQFDIQVFHPRSTYVHGRPQWLLMGGKRKPYVLRPEQLTVGFPCLVLAYRANEDKQQAVPADVAEVKSPEEEKALILAPGGYTVDVRNGEGKTESFKITVK
jgi:hypothetical protein